MHVLDHFATREISTSPIRVSRYSLDFLLTNLSGKDILLPGSFFHCIVSLDEEYRKLEMQSMCTIKKKITPADMKLFFIEPHG